MLVASPGDVWWLIASAAPVWHHSNMGRRRRAWLTNRTGKRPDGRPGYYVEWREPRPGGGRDIHRSLNFLKAADARQWCRQFNARRDLELVNRVIPVSIEDAAAEFIASCSGLSAKTRSEYRTALARLDGAARSHRVCDLAGADVDRLAGTLRHLSRSSVRKAAKAVGRFCSWCVQRRYLDRNPARDATSIPKGKDARQRPAVTDAQLGAIIAAVETEDRQIAIWLAMTTGLDRGVIRQLHAGQIDFDHLAINIRRPKTGRLVSVPLHRAIAPLLRLRSAGRPSGQPLLAGVMRDETRDGRKRDWWKRAAIAAGCPDFLFRDLRAMASSRLLRAGVSLPDVQRMLGHSSPTTTAAHYLTPAPGLVQQLHELHLPGIPRTPKSKRG